MLVGTEALEPEEVVVGTVPELMGLVVMVVGVAVEVVEMLAVPAVLAVVVALGLRAALAATAW